MVLVSTSVVLGGSSTLPKLPIIGNWTYITNLKHPPIYLYWPPSPDILCFSFYCLKISQFPLMFKTKLTCQLMFVFTTPACLSLGLTFTSNGCACSVHWNHGSHVRDAFMASDDLLSYHCSSSVQSFDRLFTSGSMHSALGVTHRSWKLASVILLIRLRIVAYEQKTCGAAHLNCDQKI